MCCGQVMVHAPEVPPIMSQKGVAVSPGFHNFLAIDIKQVRLSYLICIDNIVEERERGGGGRRQTDRQRQREGVGREEGREKDVRRMYNCFI